MNTATAKAYAHPTRQKILQVMVDNEPTSPNRLATEMDEPLGNVSYHVKCLKELGILELDHTEPRRGAVEHFYVRGRIARLAMRDDEALNAIARVLGGAGTNAELIIEIAKIVKSTNRRATP